MSESVGQWYLRHDEVALRLGRMALPDVLKLIRDKEFGVHCLRIGRYFFVPVSDFNAYCAQRRIFDETTGGLKPIYARSADELMKKVRAARKPQSS